LQRLTEVSEKAKIELSAVTETSLSLPFITANAHGPKHLDMRLTRAKFNELTRHLVERCKKPLEQALQDAKLSFGQLDEVVLVGGSTRIPAVQDLVKSLTGGKEPNQSVNPDEVVAVGAAIQAGILEGAVKDVVLLDVTPLSLGIETMGGVFTKLVERNTTIPVHKSDVFSTAEDNQPAVAVQIFQGERPIARANKSVGDFKLDGIKPAPRGLPQIEVSFDIDANGILNVAAKDKATGREQKITITATTNLSKDDIDRMIKEAQTNAAQDLKVKESADARNEADNLCYSVERQLSQLGEKVESTKKARAEQLIREIREKLQDRSEGSSLKPLLEELESVATVIVETAASHAPHGGNPTVDFQARASERKSQNAASKRGAANDDIIDVEVA
jgi:molecular chaperone DnaK